MTPSSRAAALAAELVVPDHDAASAFERAAAARAELREPLSANEALSATGWRLLARRPALPVAINLAARPLPAAQRAHLLRTEARERVLLALLAHNDLGDDEVALVLERTVRPRLATALLEQVGARNPALTRELSLLVGELPLLRWLASAPDVDEAAARGLLATFPSWAPARSYRARNTLLTRVLERFPTLVDVLVAPGQDLSAVTVAAASRHLTDPALQRLAAALGPHGATTLGPVELPERHYALLALVANPVTSDEVLTEVLTAYPGLTEVASAVASRRARARPTVVVPYDQVTDPAVLDWLVRRSLPSEYKPTGRPFDLAVLATNTHLDGALLLQALSALAYPSFCELLADRAAPLWDRLVAVHPDAARYRPTWLLDEEQGDDPTDVGGATWGSRGSGDARDELVVLSERALESAAARPVSTLAHLSSTEALAVGTVLGDALTDRDDAWDTLLALVDEFDGSVAELASVATSV